MNSKENATNSTKINTNLKDLQGLEKRLRGSRWKVIATTNKVKFCLEGYQSHTRAL